MNSTKKWAKVKLAAKLLEPKVLKARDLAIETITKTSGQSPGLSRVDLPIINDVVAYLSIREKKLRVHGWLFGGQDLQERDWVFMPLEDAEVLVKELKKLTKVKTWIKVWENCG